VAGKGAGPETAPTPKAAAEASGRRRSPRIESVKRLRREAGRRPALESAQARSERTGGRFRTAEPESLLDGEAGPAEGRGNRPPAGRRPGPRPGLRIRPGTRASTADGRACSSRGSRGGGEEPGSPGASKPGEGEAGLPDSSSRRRRGRGSLRSRSREVGGGGFGPIRLPKGSAGAFALRARPAGAERGLPSFRNPPTRRVIARPRRRDR
jgi:hypothetical protein